MATTDIYMTRSYRYVAKRGCSVRLDRTCVPGDIPQVCLSIGKGDGRYSYIPDVREAEGLRMQSRHVCVLGLGVWNAYPDMPFKVAALLITRVISVLDEHHVCVDLGYKAVARKVLCPVCFS